MKLVHNCKTYSKQHVLYDGYIIFFILKFTKTFVVPFKLPWYMTIFIKYISLERGSFKRVQNVNKYFFKQFKGVLMGKHIIYIENLLIFLWYILNIISDFIYPKCSTART